MAANEYFQPAWLFDADYARTALYWRAQWLAHYNYLKNIHKFIFDAVINIEADGSARREQKKNRPREIASPGRSACY
ncbi:hypothetical protein ACFOSS_10975 [Pseudaeromonas sharmana]|uniref:Uncharacterized protein n=1 Tax=Pseudaeromonas sharmana TaxID=328412 RepID=A0ABV8CQC7_9GAMM